MLDFCNWIKKKQESIQEAAAPVLPDPKSVDIMYIAAILTRKSQKKLWDYVRDKVEIPADWKKYCHHMTIRFMPKDDKVLPILGLEVTLVVTDIYADDKGVAVRVEPNTNSQELHMPPEQLPHVTIAVAPGVQPVYSNELLRRSESMKIPQAFLLDAFTGAKLKRGPIVPEREDMAVESFT